MAKRILVVDDEPDIRDILRILLEGEGFEVEEANNGREALEKIQKRPPDLVITDYVMPEMDGEELCRKNKKRHPHQTYSGNNAHREERRCN